MDRESSIPGLVLAHPRLAEIAASDDDVMEVL